MTRHMTKPAEGTYVPKAGDPEGSRQIAVRMPADEFNRLAAEAFATERSVSQHIRYLIRLGRNAAMEKEAQA
jgi:hypothetical protein